jgi:hypothetical protein
MSTLQVAQQPNGGNGSGANGNGHLVPQCPTGKKEFANREEAERFEADNRKLFPNQGKQYAYKCEQCPTYHLTSKPLDAFAIGQTNLKRLESLATSDSSPRVSKFRGGRGETEAEVKRLWKEGLTDAEIAAQLGISHAGVCHHRKKFGAANSDQHERNQQAAEKVRQAAAVLSDDHQDRGVTPDGANSWGWRDTRESPLSRGRGSLTADSAFPPTHGRGTAGKELRGDPRNRAALPR